MGQVRGQCPQDRGSAPGVGTSQGRGGLGCLVWGWCSWRGPPLRRCPPHHPPPAPRQAHRPARRFARHPHRPGSPPGGCAVHAPSVDEGDAVQEETGRGLVVGHPPLLECGVEEEPLHDLEVVVVVVPAVVNRLLLGDQKGQVRP